LFNYPLLNSAFKTRTKGRYPLKFHKKRGPTEAHFPKMTGVMQTWPNWQLRS